MDIDLLSKMIGELILDHDELSLPGLGTFVAEEVPASFSDRGYTVNPPYRKLSFYQRPETDHLLIDFYASSNDVSFKDASLIIVRFLDEMKTLLKEKKVIVLPGLGRLRATRENNFFFVPDADLDIYPDGFGLRPVSMKNHTESQAELSSAVGKLSGMLFSEPAPELVTEVILPAAEPSATSNVEAPQSAGVSQGSPAAAEAPANPVPDNELSEPAADVTPEVDVKEEVEKEPVVENKEESPEMVTPEAETPAETKKTVPEKKEEKKEEEKKEDTEAEKEDRAEESGKEGTKGRTGLAGGLKVLIGVAVLAAVALGVFLLLAHVAPDFIDSLLYTPQELEILNYPLD